MTGVGWGLKEEWDSEGEESVGEAEGEVVVGDTQMNETGEEEEDEDPGMMEDVFGDDGGAGDGDKERALYGLLARLVRL